MTREEAQQALQAVADDMRAQHDDDQGRLTQLDGAIATAQMAVGYLFDDAEKSAATQEG